MKTAFMFRFLMLGLILTGAIAASHAQIVSTDELIIYYSFNQDTLSGVEIADVSGNGNDGLVKGANIEPVDGIVGGGLAFPGTATDYISVRNHAYVDPFPALSMVVWVKAPVRGMIASWDRSEFFRFAVGDDVGGNAATTFVAFDHCCPVHDWFGETDVADDEWHHLVAVFDGVEKRIYVDGELDASTDATTDVIGAGQSRFGFIGIGSEAGTFDAATGPNWAFNGIMDEYLMFHRPLSEGEIQHLATGPEDPFSATIAVNPNGKLSTTWGNIKINR